MKVEITSKKTNPLLSREEIEFTVKEITVTPKTEDLRVKVAAATEGNSDTTVITKIKQKFGRKEFIGKAREYKEKEKMDRTELKYVLGRNFKKEGEKQKKEKQEKRAVKEKKKLESKKKKKK